MLRVELLPPRQAPVLSGTMMGSPHKAAFFTSAQVDETQYQTGYVRSALKLLGIEKLALAIHDQSFPSQINEETGRGTPYSYGAEEFVKLIGKLGFNGVQLGPQGKTSLGNPSPYDGTLFSKNQLSISLSRLSHDPRWANLLDSQQLFQWLSSAPTTGRNYPTYRFAWQTQQQAMTAAYANFKAQSAQFDKLAFEFTQWQKDNESWLSVDEKYEADAHSFRFGQFLAHAQHQDFRRMVNGLGLKLYGDLQIGFSVQDMQSFNHLFLPNYKLGAPPSRTNPDGQPWGYPVLNPNLYRSESGAPGPVLQWMTTRIDKVLIDYDGIRIDHPHGLVCPWVYDSTAADALQAVQQGSRLFDSPDITDHPTLAAFALVQAAQLNRNAARYADNWISNLTEDQIDRYGVLIDLVLNRMSAFGYERSNVICEVLSSCPYPLQQVLRKHNLGRLRVTQKANPDDGTDNYRSDTAKAADWIMTGTHDTEPLWLAVQKWDGDKRASWAAYLAQRLEPDAAERTTFAAKLVADETSLIEAMFADLFVGPATNVSVFFADLFGMKEVYNAPGVVNNTNWMLSVPTDFEHAYQRQIANRGCLFLPRALAMALRARSQGSQCALNLANRLADPETDAIAQ